MNDRITRREWDDTEDDERLEYVQLLEARVDARGAEIARLRAALEPFTRIFTDAASGPCEDSDVILTRHAPILSMLGVEPVTLTVGHVRAAIAALKGDA